MNNLYLMPESPARNNLLPEHEQLLKSIQSWIENREAGSGSGLSVFGIYGGRGSGKTTLMHALWRWAYHRRPGGTGTPTPIIVNTNCNHRNGPGAPDPCLFDASNTHTRGHLISEFLRHLHDYPGAGRVQGSKHNNKKHSQDADADRILDHHTRTIYPDRYLDLAKDFATSEDDLMTRMAATYEDFLAADEKIIDGFTALVRRIQVHGRSEGSPAGILILIDDLDVCAEKTLSLLEFIHTSFGRCEKIYVGIAMDRETAVMAAAVELSKRGMTEGGRRLATFLLDKWIPHVWTIPTPSWKFSIEGVGDNPDPLEEVDRFVDRCIADFSGGDQQVATDGPKNENTDKASVPGESAGESAGKSDRSLKYWWPEELGAYLRRQEADKRGRLEREPRDRDRGDLTRGDVGSDSGPIPDESELRLKFIRTYFVPLLPNTPRKLKRLINNLWIRKDADESAGSAELPFGPAGRKLVSKWGIPADLIRPAICLLEAIDVSLPELDVRDAFENHFDVFTSLVKGQAWQELGDAEPRRQRSRIDTEPVGDRLNKEWFPGRALGDAQYRVELAAKAWGVLGELAAHGAPEPGLFVAASMDADAVKFATSVWSTVDKPRLTDLRYDIVDGVRRRDRDSIVQCRDRFLGQLAGSPVLQRTDQELDVALRVPLSIALWLGWTLRQQRRVHVTNTMGGQVTRIKGPLDRIQYKDIGLWWHMNQEEMEDQADVAPLAGHVIVLVDVLGNTAPVQLTRFLGADTGQISPQRRIRLYVSKGLALTADVMEELLGDVIELLGQLRTGGITDIHLGLSCPDTFAFLLGREVHEWARFHIYEFRDQAYHFVFQLDDEPKRAHG